VERHGRLVEKEELFQAVWPDTIVEESNLSSNIALIRKALGDGEKGLKFIETVPKRGYRFVAEVREMGAEQVEIAEASARNDEAEAQPGSWSSKATGYKKGALIALVASVIGLGGIAFGLYKFVNQSQSKSSHVEPRIIPFTSFPSNELDPSFSPDGNQIAFAWDGEKSGNYDIYVKQIGTDALLRLTTSPATDRNPIWSPDGRYIAFSRFSKESGAGLYLIPSLGGAERKITERRIIYESAAMITFNLYIAGWAPDGEWLAIADNTLAEEAPGIFLVARETGERRRLTSPPAGSLGDGYPAFSPDGRTVAFARNTGGGMDELYLSPVAGGEARRLTFDNAFAINPVWISEGREILFYSNRGGGINSLWKIPATGGTPQRLETAAQGLSSFSLARQGNRLAWSQRADDNNIWRIEMAATTTAKQAPTMLISSTRQEYSAQFSPDGQKIVFASNRSGSFEIWVCSSDGQRPAQLTAFNHSVAGSPRWSPDGRQIAFDARPEGNADIYVITAEGGQPRRLTTEDSADNVPSWSRDGQWIYFCSNRSGSLQIWKMPAAGGQAVQITHQGGFDNVESPDGQYLYYAKGRGVPGIWRIPVAGGEETSVLKHHRAGINRQWAVTEKGIYFTTTETPDRPLIEFFSFATGKVTTVATLAKTIYPISGLAVSPDGRWLIWPQLDQVGSDIMLMENFR
ncbi:MAG: DPP IV N-terminal domain-containing protein, partial [Acidobacteria bacterium]|nr:DPP IV N-terminal domain-containing protein [Acidobacteriota bacterium]